MRSAVEEVAGVLLPVNALLAGGKREVRVSEIGTIKNDDFIVVKKLHVHRRYTNTLLN